MEYTSEKIANTEVERQNAFIGEAAGYVKLLENEKGRKLRSCIVTFGCEIETEYGIA